MALFLFTVEIRTLLRLTTNLIDICYDCRSGVRSISEDKSLDIDRATTQLRELRDVLENLFDSWLATKPKSLTRAAHELLLRYKNEMSGLEATLMQGNGRETARELPSSLGSEVIMNLTLINKALRDFKLIGEDQK